MCAWRICCSMMSMLFSNYPTNHASTPSLSWVFWMFLVDISLFPARIVIYPIRSILLMLKIPINPNKSQSPAFPSLFGPRFIFPPLTPAGFALSHPHQRRDAQQGPCRHSLVRWLHAEGHDLPGVRDVHQEPWMPWMPWMPRRGAVWKWPIEIVDLAIKEN